MNRRPERATAPRHAALWTRIGRMPGVLERADLDGLIDAKLDEAAVRWPMLDAERERFLIHWGSTLPPGGDLRVHLSATHVGDLYLAFCCLEGRRDALASLERELLPHLLPSLRKIDPAASFVEDVRQQLLERLLVRRGDEPPRLAAYAGQSTLLHWMRAVALRLALNVRRTAHRSPEQGADTAELEVAAPVRDPQLEILRSRFGSSFGETLRGAFERLDRRERSLLRLHYLEGLSLAQIGATYQVNKSTVSRWMDDARQTLLETVRTELESRHGIARGEVDSLVRELESQVDVSLASMLRSRP